MKKYKFYVNRRTKNHPSLELSSNKKKWKNLELTPSLIKTGRYIELKLIQIRSKPKKAFIRKYVRNDPIKTRGDLLRKYNLSEEDLKEIERYLLSIKKVSVKPTILGLWPVIR